MMTRVRYLHTKLASANTHYSVWLPVCAPYKKNVLKFENLTLRLLAASIAASSPAYGFI